MKKYFPQDFLIDIFSRLSPRSLMRFKCLTKRWRVLFSNSKFIKYHLDDKNFLTSTSFLFLRIESSFEGEGTLEAVAVKYPREATDFLPFVAHDDGILCMLTKSCMLRRPPSIIVVWNPFTNEHKRFVLSLEPKYQGIGFGYDSAIDDHRVVFITGSRKIHSMRLKTGLLNTAVQSVDYQFTISTDNRMAMAVDNCLYWMATKEVPGMLVILCFDLERDELREETSLCGNDFLTKQNSVLGLLDGCLCLASTFDNIHSDVWVMEENRVTKTKSWIKLFRIPKIGQRRDVNTVYLPVYPMAFTRSGQVLITECGQFGLCLFDLRDGSFKEIATRSPYRYCLAPNCRHFELIRFGQNLASLGGMN